VSRSRVPGDEDILPSKCARAYIAAGMAIAVDGTDRRLETGEEI